VIVDRLELIGQRRRVRSRRKGATTARSHRCVGQSLTRWKPALNAFAITFEGRLFPSNTH
jgi:hypothetical protein